MKEPSVCGTCKQPWEMFMKCLATLPELTSRDSSRTPAQELAYQQLDIAARAPSRDACSAVTYMVSFVIVTCSGVSL